MICFPVHADILQIICGILISNSNIALLCINGRLLREKGKKKFRPDRDQKYVRKNYPGKKNLDRKKKIHAKIFDKKNSDNNFREKNFFPEKIRENKNVAQEKKNFSMEKKIDEKNRCEIRNPLGKLGGS